MAMCPARPAEKSGYGQSSQSDLKRSFAGPCFRYETGSCVFLSMSLFYGTIAGLMAMTQAEPPSRFGPECWTKCWVVSCGSPNRIRPSWHPRAKHGWSTFTPVATDQKPHNFQADILRRHCKSRRVGIYLHLNGAISVLIGTNGRWLCLGSDSTPCSLQAPRSSTNARLSSIAAHCTIDRVDNTQSFRQ